MHTARRFKIQGSKEKKISLMSKNVWLKKKESVFRRRIDWTPCKSNINTVKDHFENRHSGIVANVEIPSTSSQTVEQIEIIKEIISSELSKLNGPVMQKNQELKAVFFRKRRQKK